MIGYGKELILDLRGCNPGAMNRKTIGAFMEQACAAMEVEACDLHFWDDEGVAPEECQTDPKRKGVTAVQFLLASNITVHTLDLRREVYLNAFSCEAFDERPIVGLALRSFGGHIVWQHVVIRGLPERALAADPEDLYMLAFGLERVAKICDWAIARIGPEGELRERDPDGTTGLSVDYGDLQEGVASLEADLIKVGLCET